MRENVSQSWNAVRQADAPAATEIPAVRGRLRVRWVAAGLTVLVAGGLAAAWSAGAFASGAPAGNQGLPPPATQAVTRQNLSATTPVTATLGYAGSYTARGHGGTLTWLPPPGQLIRQGQVLYRTNNGWPTVLLYGRVPAWRALAPGITGADVSQLNRDLAALGDAASVQLSAAGWDTFSAATQTGVRKLQAALGVASPPGAFSLGSLVFEPTGLRVAMVTGSLGATASGPVLTATSDRHVVTIALDTAQQSEVRAGDAVSVTLPDGSSTPGTVSSVGSVATTSAASGGSVGPGGAGSSGSTATIPVTVVLKDPAAAGSLDQAPVTVYITTATAHDALVVPVAALLAQSSGGYAVEVAGAGNARRLVRVTVGIFDDTDGLVQVTGALAAGQRVVVAAT
jgi:hypothetical protein